MVGSLMFPTRDGTPTEVGRGHTSGGSLELHCASVPGPDSGSAARTALGPTGPSSCLRRCAACEDWAPAPARPVQRAPAPAPGTAPPALTSPPPPPSSQPPPPPPHPTTPPTP